MTARSKDLLSYQQLSSYGSREFTEIHHRFAAKMDFYLSIDAERLLAKPFGQLIILVFEMGDNPPTTGGKA
jgi:hypothetical protein